MRERDSAPCGRLVISKTGVVKRVELAQGGGTRKLNLTHIDMGFDEIHDRLREVFQLDQTNRSSTVYDFQQKKLDTNRYRTFYEYVSQNGLKFKGTLLYLCTSEDDEHTVDSRTPRKRKHSMNSTPDSHQPRKKPSFGEAKSSASTLEIKIEDSPPQSRQSNNGSSQKNSMVENLRLFSAASYVNYSFENFLNEFVNHLRHLISQYNHENILIQLLEDVCTVRGLSSINLDQLKHRHRSIGDHQRLIYNDVLQKIEKLSRSMKAFIELNKIKISNIDKHSTISDAFNHFHRNFNILYDEWNNNSNTNKYNRSSSSNRSDDHRQSKTPTFSAQNDSNTGRVSRNDSSTYHTHQRKESRSSTYNTTSRSNDSKQSKSSSSSAANNSGNSRPLKSSSSSTNYSNDPKPTRFSSSYTRNNASNSESLAGVSSLRNHSHDPKHSTSTSSPAISNSKPSKSSSSSTTCSNNLTQTKSSSSYATNNSSNSRSLASSSASKNYSNDLSQSKSSSFSENTSSNSSRPTRSSSSSTNYSNDLKQTKYSSSRATNHSDNSKSSRSSPSSANYSNNSHQSRISSSWSNYSNEPKQSRISSASSTYHPDDAKQSINTSTSTPSSRKYPSHSSLNRISIEDSSRPSFFLRKIIDSLDSLSDVVYQLRFTSFNNLTKSLMNQVETLLSTTKLSDCQSLADAVKLINSIEQRLTNRLNDEHRRAHPHKISQKLECSFNQTLDSLGEFLKRYDRDQPQIEKDTRNRRARSPSEYRPSTDHKYIETKPCINANAQHVKFEDDQSSDASNSSLGDEVLMEVARSAFEQRTRP